MQFLRVYDLTESLAGKPEMLLEKVHAINEREPSADKVYILSELSYIQAKRVEASTGGWRWITGPRSSTPTSTSSMTASVRSATRTIRTFAAQCDLYNGALEANLRLLAEEKGFMPGQSHTIHTAGGSWDVTCVLRGDTWQPEDVGRFEFVSDYEIKGLKNHYQSYGLGVPLIAVRKNFPHEPAVARYLSGEPELSGHGFFPPDSRGPRRESRPSVAAPRADRALRSAGGQRHFRERRARAVGERSDHPAGLFPLQSGHGEFRYVHGGSSAPRQPAGRATKTSRPIVGLYMVQPYQPGKIPVLLVHGLWSSPMTWMPMFNDLRSCPEIRDHYQFWFYLYPTAQPFWVSAARLRTDLAELRQTLDPGHREPALDQMIIVGHSMGGLLARLQTLASGNDYWNLVSRKPFAELKAHPQVRDLIGSCFFSSRIFRFAA